MPANLKAGKFLTHMTCWQCVTLDMLSAHRTQFPMYFTLEPAGMPFMLFCAEVTRDALTTGGNVRNFVLFGFIQQWLWPALVTDRLLPKMFGLIDLMKWLKQGEPSDTDRSR